VRKETWEVSREPLGVIAPEGCTMLSRWIEKIFLIETLPSGSGVWAPESGPQGVCAEPFLDGNAMQTLPRNDRDHCASQGFTLKELAITLVLVAIIGVVVMSRRSTTNYDAYADAETLKGALRNTRTRAMADIVPWSFVVSGQTGTFQRNGVDHSTITFATIGVAPGTVTFSTRGIPSGTMSFSVAYCSYSPVVITSGTGYVP
jgi:hypothetical protein